MKTEVEKAVRFLEDEMGFSVVDSGHILTVFVGDSEDGIGQMFVWDTLIDYAISLGFKTGEVRE